MSEIQTEKPQYEIHFLDVGDADCIAIKYRKGSASRAYVALIDAGNVTDAPKIKEFLKNQFGTLEIDLAVCTHPDSDHKGGFFELLEDGNISIREFWLKDPYAYVTDEEFLRMKRSGSKIVACRRAYDHPSDSSKNLIDLISKKCNVDGTFCVGMNVCPGAKCDDIPIVVLGPVDEYYQQAAKGIVQEFAELKMDPDMKKYDELLEVSEDEAKSVIDEVKDESYTNMGSLILYFTPSSDRRILLAGDASQTSLGLTYLSNKYISGCVLKVPHHGSKHNLNSKLIDEIKPAAAIISAAGTRKHPNPAIVRYLSKYCNVFSTHFSGDLSYTSYPYGSRATPLKAKCS